MVITLADLASHRHFTCPNKHPQRFIISVNLIIEICIFEQYNDRRVMPDYRDYCFLFWHSYGYELNLATGKIGGKKFFIYHLPIIWLLWESITEIWNQKFKRFDYEIVGWNVSNPEFCQISPMGFSYNFSSDWKKLLYIFCPLRDLSVFMTRGGVCWIFS